MYKNREVIKQVLKFQLWRQRMAPAHPLLPGGPWGMQGFSEKRDATIWLTWPVTIGNEGNTLHFNSLKSWGVCPWSVTSLATLQGPCTFYLFRSYGDGDREGDRGYAQVFFFFMINTILKTTCKPKRLKHIISERACSSATTIIVYKPYNPGNLSAVRS